MILIGFDHDKIPSELVCDNGRRSASGKWIEYEIARISTCKNYLGKKLFRLLCRMVRVLRHRPERDGYIGPDIRRMSVSKISVVGYAPVLRFSIFTIWREHSPSLLHGVKIKSEIIRHREE